MIQHMFRIPLSATVLKQAIANVNTSIVIERNSIQKAKYIADNLPDFVSMNESVNGLMQKLMKLQTLIQNKLQYIKETLQEFENFHKKGNLDKSAQEIDTFDGDDELEE